MNSNGLMTKSVVPSRHGVLSLSSTRPAALICTSSSGSAGRAMLRHSCSGHLRSRASSARFVGHMHATRKALAKRLLELDPVFEQLEVRQPGSSASPLLARIVLGADGRPTLKVANKQEIAEPARTAQWLAHW